MKLKKLIITIFALLAVFAAVGCAKDEDYENAQRIDAIYSYLRASYNGEFNIVSNEPVIIEDDEKTYGYRFVTDDDRQIEFTAYYEKGSFLKEILM